MIEQGPPGLEDELLRRGREDDAVHDEAEEGQLARGDDLPRAGTGSADDRLRDVSRRLRDPGVRTRRWSGERRSRQLPCRFAEVTDEPFYLSGCLNFMFRKPP